MKDGKEEEAPERWWRFLAWLRRAFKPPRLHWLVFAIIVFLLSILAPKMGIAAALQFILIGLGLGALLTWAVSSWPPGSGVPPLRRIRFFNQSDRDAAGITFRKNPPPGLTIIPPPSGVNLIPPPPPNVPPGGAFMVDSAPSDVVATDVMQVQVDFNLDLPRGVVALPGIPATIPVSLCIPPAPLVGERVEEVDVAVGTVPGSPANYTVTVLLYSRLEEELAPDTPPNNPLHWPEQFTFQF